MIKPISHVSRAIATFRRRLHPGDAKTYQNTKKRHFQMICSHLHIDIEWNMWLATWSAGQAANSHVYKKLLVTEKWSG